VLTVVEVQQRGLALIANGDNVTALASIATARTAARHKPLTAKGDAAVPAVSGRDVKCCLVDEHGDTPVDYESG